MPIVVPTNEYKLYIRLLFDSIITIRFKAADPDMLVCRSLSFFHSYDAYRSNLM